MMRNGVNLTNELVNFCHKDLRWRSDFVFIPIISYQVAIFDTVWQKMERRLRKPDGLQECQCANVVRGVIGDEQECSGSKVAVNLLLHGDDWQNVDGVAAGQVFVAYSDLLPRFCTSQSVRESMNIVIAEVRIPDSVRELCDHCFMNCPVCRVTFGPSSSVERIGVHCMAGTRIREVSIPDSVRQLCDHCFYRCTLLSLVIFGQSSSLEVIGTHWISETNVKELFLPNNVRELCDRCFCDCLELRHVTFGSGSKLERIGNECFYWTKLETFKIPPSVVFVGARAFGLCAVCSDNYRFSVLNGLLIDYSLMSCVTCIARLLTSVSIPDCVLELGDWCFYGCGNLHDVTFGSSCLVERFGDKCFCATGLKRLVVPDSVRELGNGCFSKSRDLVFVTFGRCSSLEIIGTGCFYRTQVRHLRVPDHVRQLCDRCFAYCWELRRVTFGPSLERIGNDCFLGSGLLEFTVPPSVIIIGGGAFGQCPLSDGFVCTDNSRFSVRDGLLIERSSMSCVTCIDTRMSSVVIPDCVLEIGDRCFSGCWNLCHVSFGPSSSLKRIGVEAFSGQILPIDYLQWMITVRSGIRSRDTWYGCRIEEIEIPDSVFELCDRCFYGCTHLRRVTFGKKSSLTRIGFQAFEDTYLEKTNVETQEYSRLGADSRCEVS